MQTISEDTQAVLLLCGIVPGARVDDESPLSPSEFYRLSRWLKKEQSTPAQLLDEFDSARLAEWIAEHQIAPERIERLLGRGMTLAVATERWLQMGLWILSVFDDDFPARLKDKLQDKAMPLLFGIGDAKLLSGGGLAVVGSRNADESALDFARKAGEWCARNNMTVISGAARGIDLTAMQGALDVQGQAVGALTNDLARQAVSPETRAYLQAGNLTLASPFSPEAPFHAGNAMARNKYIYALADAALVVSAEAESGGTWSGAVENLKYGWTPLWVRQDASTPRGNEALIRRGAQVMASSRLTDDASPDSVFRDKGKADDLSLFDN